MEAIDEVLREFLNESYKNLDLMARDLSALESHPDQKEPAVRLCRILHTSKGTSGMLGFPLLQKMSQAGENLLEKIRDGRLVFQPKHAVALRRLSDVLEDALECLQRNQSDEGVEIEPVTGELLALAAEKTPVRKN